MPDDIRAAVPPACDHVYASKHQPGHLLYWIRQCMVCHEVDWDDLDRDIGNRVAAERERIRQLAIRNEAVCAADEGTCCYFADLIREPRERSEEGTAPPVAAELDGQLPLPGVAP